MSKILVLYYSSYGHTENMANIIAEGAGGVEGTEVTIKRVPELVSEEVMKQANYKVDQASPVATVDELPEYDAYIFGTPTRYGSMCSQMRNFLDQTGGLWLQGAFVGKVGSAFVTTACQHGGQETTLTSFHTTLLHMGMIIVGVPFSCSELLSIDEVSGGSPYGAGSISTRDGSRSITEKERAIGLFQGKHVAEVARRQTVG